MWWRGFPAKDAFVDYAEPVRIVQFSDDPKLWDDYVDRHPAGTIYHRQDWRKVIEQSFGYECPSLAALSGSTIIGVLPMTIVKSPFFGTYITSCAFSDYGGICSNDNTSAQMLLNAGITMAKDVKARSLELRHVLPLNLSNLSTNTKKVLSVLELPDSEEVLWKAFDSKLRNQIRKAMKGGMSIRWGHEELLSDFYGIFLRNMRDLGTPAPGIEFFKHIVKIHGKAADVLVLYQGDIPISGAVALTYRNAMEVPWASSLRNFFSLLPNNLLYWTLLQKSIARKFDFFSFGRSTVDSSTYMFKAQWNTQPIILNYQSYACTKESYGDMTPGNPKYRLAISAWKKMPISLVKKLGPCVAKGLA